MIYNKKKHYYDPYDSLDVEWKARISHEMLSTGNVAHLSGSSPITSTGSLQTVNYCKEKQEGKLRDYLEGLCQVVLCTSCYSPLHYRLRQLLSKS